MSTTGYSGKPLYQKMGLKPGMTCLLIGAPDHYRTLVDGVDGVRFVAKSKGADVVHLFCRTKAELRRRIDKALSSAADPGMVWVSWPKKSSPLFRDVTEDTLREVILPTGWVDVKVCAVDTDWSGLKFLRRKTPQAAKETT